VPAIQLAAGDAAVHVAPELGGAITSYMVRGRPVLRETPATAFATGNVRLASCYPLVPYSNRIRDATLSFGGRDHPLDRNFGSHPHAIHGVGWQRAWSVVFCEPARMQLSLVHDPSLHGERAWPWSFRATQTFELAPAASLSVTMTIANTDVEPFPFGLGWHPFFAADAATAVSFLAGGMWENDDTQLPLHHVGVPAAWPFHDGRMRGDVVLDNVFTGWSGRADVVAPSSGVRAALSADRACRFLVVYAPPQADFIAIEPVTHETDAFNRAAQGARDTGCRVLAPGQPFSCTMRVAASALD